jgi:hypothetical protein
VREIKNLRNELANLERGSGRYLEFGRRTAFSRKIGTE